MSARPADGAGSTGPASTTGSAGSSSRAWTGSRTCRRSKSHPMTTAPEVVARIEELALAHPAYGCNRIEALLALEGRRVSAITVQKILNDRGLGTRHERWLALERRNADHTVELSAEQAAFLERLNPCFRERHVESTRPGELLSADTFMAGNLKGIGRVYLHAVADTFGSYAFFLHVSKQPEAAAVLHNDVLPFYRELDLPVGAALQAELDAWLHHYNHERPHLGYRNQGRRPGETVQKLVRQED